MKKYSKEQITDYLNLIGLDESEYNFTEEQLKTGIRLNNISELYIKTNAKELLPPSSKEVGSSYEILDRILNDPFWYESKVDRIYAKKTAFSLINKYGSIDLEENDKDILFEKENELLKTIIRGLSECGNIQQFKFYLDNATVSNLVNKMSVVDNPSDLNKLYGLVALTKFSSFDISLIFDDDNKIKESNILKAIQNNLTNNIPIKENEYTSETEYKRLPYKKLKEKKL
ncbi:MAG: hypothetical protein IJ568_03815 [Bacilli bacterium]|nr:hypothetical protein [Bacilli bacterium]